MSLTLELRPEVERELARRAAACGMDVPAYAAILLEEAAQPSVRPRRKQTLSEFLMESPLAGSELNLERDKDSGRTTVTNPWQAT